MLTSEPTIKAGQYSIGSLRSQFVAGCLRFICLVVVLLGSHQLAKASVVFELSPVDNSSALTGYVTYDLQVTTETDWTSAAMLVQLDAGHIYQHTLGGSSEVQYPPLFISDPALAFDTHVKGTVAGGAGDLDGTGFAFTTDRLDVSWFNMDWSDIGTTTIGRLTLSDDAAGTMALFTGGQRFDVVLGAGVAPVVTAVVEEEPEAEPEPEYPAISLPTETYWDYVDFYRCPTLAGGYVEPLIYRYQPLDIDTRVWTPSDELEGLFTNKIYTDSTKFDRRYVDFVNGRRENVLNAWSDGTSLVLTSADAATLPEPGTIVCLGLGLGLIVRRQRYVPISDCAHSVSG